MIRILHVIGSLNFGGSQSLVISILERLDRRKIQFDFMIDKENETQLKTKVESLGAKVFCLPTFNGRNTITYLKSWNNFFEKHPEYHVIHGHVRSTASLYLSVAKRHGLITIAHSHNTSSGTGGVAIVKNFLQYFIRYTADYFFSCSDEAGIWLFGKKIVGQSNYRVLPNAIDFSAFQFDEAERIKWRQSLGVNRDFVVGHIGRFHEQKNHLFLIQVFSEIKKRKSNAKLVLLGGFDNDEYPKCIELTKRLELEDSIIFFGPTQDAGKIMNAFDCFVFPSLWEGFPIALLEAQANGLACYVSSGISSDAGITTDYDRLSLKDSAAAWANQILAGENKRNPGVYCAKYDIAVAAKEMQRFYVDIHRNGKGTTL